MIILRGFSYVVMSRVLLLAFCSLSVRRCYPKKQIVGYRQWLLVARGRYGPVLLVSPDAGAVAFGALLAFYGWILAYDVPPRDERLGGPYA